MIFGGVRENALFSRVLSDFWWNFGDFGVVRSGENGVFSGFCRSGYRSGCLDGFGVRMLGNAYFIRSLWIEQICRS